MNRRNRLTWVTALTVSSLLLGGGALNAFAQGHGDGGEHGGAGEQAKKAEHQPPPGVATAAKHDDQENDHDNGNANHNKTNNGNANNGNHPHQDDGDVERGDDHEDLVTAPSRVTGEDRPGLGCGDDNHVHMGPPGNPDKVCKPHEDDGDKHDDDSAMAPEVAGADSQAAAMADDSAGD